MWLVERFSETQARSCSRPVLTVRTQLSSYMKEEYQEDWTGIFSLRGRTSALSIWPWAQWHVDVFAPPETEPQHTNRMLSLTQSVDPGQAHGERVAAVGSALRFDEACNLHRGVAAESLLGRVLDGCRSARLAASKVTV